LECRDDPGYGWVAFAAVLLLMLGTLNLLEGLALVETRHTLAEAVTTSWGLSRIGDGLWCSSRLSSSRRAFGVLVKNQFSRWTGAAILAVNGGVQVLTLPTHLTWSLSTIALGLVGVYGLVACGKRCSGAGRATAFSAHPSRRLRFRGPLPGQRSPSGLLPSGDLDGGGLNDSMQWRRWHRSAQKVDRAWSEWLAGDGQRAARPGIFKRATRDEACVRHRWTERHGQQREPWRGG
jgi:hypothetical protein